MESGPAGIAARLAELLAVVAEDKLEPRFELLHRLFAAALLLQQRQEGAEPEPVARAVLLAALLRWGDSPQTVQTVLSAYTAAALRLAQHVAQQQQQPPPLEPPGQEEHGNPQADEEREEDQQRGRGTGKQQQRQQRAAAHELGASLAAAEQAVGSLLDLKAAMHTLAAACDVLQPATPLAPPPGGPSCSDKDDGSSSSLDALRAFWFAEEKGLRLVTAAQALWHSSVTACDGPQGLAAAIGAAVERAAVALDSSSGAAGGGDPRSSGTSDAAASALDLACACVVQPRWAALCRRLAGAPGAGCERRRPGQEQAGAGPATTEAASAASALAAAAVACELGQALAGHPALLISSAPEALAAACWAEPRLGEACVAALASPACVGLATGSAAAADRLQRLLPLLQELGCLSVQ
ncbi:hypothetical protein Rsub_00155 [Raphidocelis subcapitata]|uniref:Uncharacterized protein n=1 Tax=Raphidocelis subcapitata TaxID=307507 RepID=A0A2V0NJN5_9CHLO|nr:hypothetical protein Rsub_00155 [Raphidocelis subcapitata]|eukprot:GBF87444.1 hypothetical protein Rsub_00155 [Raphidocelis subcapitata]